MSRFPNVRHRQDRTPRSKDRVFNELAMAQRLYLETGGDDIDFGIRSARRMLEAYDRQEERGPDAGQTPITHAEANRARAQLASLTRQREQKMARCRADVEEVLEAEAEQEAETPQEPAQTEFPAPQESVAPRTSDAPAPMAAASD